MVRSLLFDVVRGASEFKGAEIGDRRLWSSL